MESALMISPPMRCASRMDRLVFPTAVGPVRITRGGFFPLSCCICFSDNVLAFPGIFRGTFDVRASEINEEMKMAAAKALADIVSDEELSADYIIPKAFDPRVCPAVSKAVAEAARRTGVARI